MATLSKLFSVLRGRASAEKRHLKHSQHIHFANPWHAVSIVSQRPNCPVCGRYKGVRFLASEAPQLPLKGCPDPKGCNTVYKHFPDRRSGPRRAAELRAFAPMTPTVVTRQVRDDRRHVNGRRDTDGR
jgi:hypothetical protein